MPPPSGSRDSQESVEGGGTSISQGREHLAALLLVAVAICGHSVNKRQRKNWIIVGMPENDTQ
eukprot:scaffold570611_cov13-Prasinocladus_malaysianus.AAC.1